VQKEIGRLGERRESVKRKREKKRKRGKRE
jgi:hypothetical protein